MTNESKWWSDIVGEYSLQTITDKWCHAIMLNHTLRSLTDEIIEIKQARAEARKLNIKHDCEIIYNQYTEQRE